MYVKRGVRNPNDVQRFYAVGEKLAFNIISGQVDGGFEIYNAPEGSVLVEAASTASQMLELDFSLTGTMALASGSPKIPTTNVAQLVDDIHVRARSVAQPCAYADGFSLCRGRPVDGIDGRIYRVQAMGPLGDIRS